MREPGLRFPRSSVWAFNGNEWRADVQSGSDLLTFFIGTVGGHSTLMRYTPGWSQNRSLLSAGRDLEFCLTLNAQELLLLDKWNDCEQGFGRIVEHRHGSRAVPA